MPQLDFTTFHPLLVSFSLVFGFIYFVTQYMFNTQLELYQQSLFLKLEIKKIL